MTLSSNASVIEPPSPSENVSVPPWNAPPPWGGPSTMAGSPLSPAPPPEPTTWSTTRSANGSAPASPTEPMTATAHSARRFMVPPPSLPGRWTRVHTPATLATGLARNPAPSPRKVCLLAPSGQVFWLGDPPPPVPSRLAAVVVTGLAPPHSCGAARASHPLPWLALVRGVIRCTLWAVKSPRNESIHDGDASRHRHG